MLKRFLSLFLCAVLLLSNFTSVSFASAAEDNSVSNETDTLDPVTRTVSVKASPDVELPDNDELFAYFVERELYGYESAVYGTAARERLNAVERAIYDALKAQIETVALNGGSTVFPLSGISGLKTSWTNEELGVTSIEDDTVVDEAFLSQFDMNSVLNALLFDCPFDLYWFDKTVGMGMGYSMSVSGYSTGGQNIWNAAHITDFAISFSVADAYKSGDDVVTSNVAKISAVKNTAAKVVADHAGKSDYEKMVAYKTYICDAVSYNHAAADDRNTPYGDPWQLIYVFDGDDATNVVCEGYSKAFQYLCDLTAFQDDTVCYSVTGQMDDENHMWNIVTLEGKNYLVDVTNSDSGTAGADGSLFFVGGTGSIAQGYTVGGYRYTYDEETVKCWGNGADSVLILYDPAAPFVDVSKTAFYYDPVMWAVQNGVTTGATETTFNPNGNCLRAHVVTFLHRAAGNMEPTSTKNPFTDVASGAFYYKPVLWAVGKNITNGTSATTFGAMENCNRAAVVTFLWRASGSPEPTSTSNPFVDVAETAFYYKAVLWAVENGITNGVDATHFGPTAVCNRAQVVTFLHRAYK